METGFIIWGYSALVIVSSILSFYLLHLNRRSMKSVSDASLPDLVQRRFDKEALAKSKEYSLAKSKRAGIELGISAFVLLAFSLSGVLGSLDALVPFSGLTHGVLYILLLGFILSLIDLPLDAYSTFRLEERFGFNTTTLKTWVADKAKGYLLGGVLGALLLYAVLAFMKYSGELWWVVAFLFVVAFQLVLLYVYPVFIAPLFNTFSPIEDEELREKIFSLAEKLEFPLTGIYTMDGSKRSRHGNAYFTGLGKNKRVVLFDTLLEELSHEQILAVLAHEIGHRKKNHILKQMLLGFLILLAGLYLLHLMLSWEELFVAFGFEGASSHAALTLILFFASPVTFFLSPLFNVLSRKYEYEADAYAAAAEGVNGRDLAEALLALGKKSLAQLCPHPWYSFFYYSHPTLPERVDKLTR